MTSLRLKKSSSEFSNKKRKDSKTRTVKATVEVTMGVIVTETRVIIKDKGEIITDLNITDLISQTTEDVKIQIVSSHPPPNL